MHRNGAIVRGIEPIVSGDRVDVAVEHQADDSTLGIDQGAARVSTDDVVAGRDAERRVHVELPFHLHPAIGYLERRRAGRAFEDASEAGEGLHRRAVLDPPLYRTVVEPQRECGVRVDIGAVYLEPRRRDSFRRRCNRRLHFVLIALADGAGVDVDRPCDFYHRVERRIHRRLTAQP